MAMAQPVVQATTPVAVDSFNRRLLAAAAAGAIWPRDPLLVTREFIGSLGGRYLAFDKQDGPAGSVIVTAVRDGIQDAQLAGEWVRLQLAPRWREPSGEAPHQLWLLQAGQRAWRCQRGDGVFQVQPCS